MGMPGSSCRRAKRNSNASRERNFSSATGFVKSDSLGDRKLQVRHRSIIGAKPIPIANPIPSVIIRSKLHGMAHLVFYISR